MRICVFLQREKRPRTVLQSLYATEFNFIGKNQREKQKAAENLYLNENNVLFTRK